MLINFIHFYQYLFSYNITSFVLFTLVYNDLVYNVMLLLICYKIS